MSAAGDQEARERAVNPTRSVILQAPAGSGKTTVLIERLLVLLAQAESPEEILAITFTRKAAAEMALRVARVLKPPNPVGSDERAQHLERLAAAVRARSQARGWRLAENPERLRIQTLDALNRSLASQMPLLARGAGSLNVLDQPETAYAIAARRALLDAQSDPALCADVQLLFERMENEFSRCEGLIAGMLAQRMHWLPHLAGDAGTNLAARVQDSVAAVVATRLARVRQLLAANLLEEGLSIGAAAARHLRSRNTPPGLWNALSAESRPGGTHPGLRQWQALAALALTQKGEWRKRLSALEGFPPEDELLKQRCSAWIAVLGAHRGLAELLDELRELPDPQLSADETRVLGVLARLLQLAVAELEVVFSELGRVDYPAIAAAARAALGSVDEPTDLALRWDTRIRHIMVDEFQDTSLEQTRLLALLTAGWEPGDGRTLFLVGDPMQSIYGFREAEVGMFLGARTAGIGTVRLDALTLGRNFRSAPALVEWNNSVFAQCFPQLDDPRTSSVAYAPSIAARPPDTPGAVHLHRVLPGDISGEARQITQIVAQLRATEPDASIAILLGARAHAGPIVAALAAAQIPVTGVQLLPLHELSIVRDLTALARALDHLADRTAWLAILRAPWCGLTLTQISQIAGTDRRAIMWERVCDGDVQASLAPEARARVRRLQQALTVAFDEMQQSYANGREALARRIESAWLRLGGPAACAQEADVAHAGAFFAALERWSREPDWTGAQELPRRLKRLYAEHQAQHAQAVQIMTIHRAKGLEFDHVILPALGRQRRRGERALLKWLDLPRENGGTDLLMVAVPATAATGPSALGRYVARLQEQRERNEATRLLYVAATRARGQLHLFGQLDAATAQKPNPAPRGGTLLQRLWPALQGLFPNEARPLDTVEPYYETMSNVVTLERLAANWHLPRLPAGPQPQLMPVASYEATPPQDPAGMVEQAACDILRSLARRARLPEGERALEELMDARLQHLGCPAPLLSQRTAQGVEVLQACLADARLQWIFTSLTAPESRAEVPLALTGVFAGRLTSIRADVSFVDQEGCRWLIDFAPRPALTALEPAFAVRLARHVRLATALDGTAARAAVYLPGDQLFWTGLSAEEASP